MINKLINKIKAMDAPIVVGLEIAQLGILIDRQLLQVKARGVDMRSGEVDAVFQPLLPDHRQQQSLAAYRLVDLRPGGEIHARLPGQEALCLCQ